jgi:hypothetical protein
VELSLTGESRACETEPVSAGSIGFGSKRQLVFGSYPNSISKNALAEAVTIPFVEAVEIETTRNGTPGLHNFRKIPDESAPSTQSLATIKTRKGLSGVSLVWSFVAGIELLYHGGNRESMSP